MDGLNKKNLVFSCQFMSKHWSTGCRALSPCDGLISLLCRLARVAGGEVCVSVTGLWCGQLWSPKIIAENLARECFRAENIWLLAAVWLDGVLDNAWQPLSCTEGVEWRPLATVCHRHFLLHLFFPLSFRFHSLSSCGNGNRIVTCHIPPRGSGGGSIPVYLISARPAVKSAKYSALPARGGVIVGHFLVTPIIQRAVLGSQSR